ncbi:hypothetical protein D3Z47_04490 [Lachnospiraceae bacterium]|nr:hypothetical protein [Lachnospiraceae bacterium]
MGLLACVSYIAGCIWDMSCPPGIITIPILAYGIYPVNRKAVPVWESLVPMLCQIKIKKKYTIHMIFHKKFGIMKNLISSFLVLMEVFEYTKDTFIRKR